jgi:hypothetical protein
MLVCRHVECTGVKHLQQWFSKDWWIMKFHSALSTSEVKQQQMNYEDDREWCVGKNSEGGDRCIFQDSNPAFAIATKEIHLRLKSWMLPVARPRFEPDTSRLQVQSVVVIAVATLLGVCKYVTLDVPKTGKATDRVWTSYKRRLFSSKLICG